MKPSVSRAVGKITFLNADEVSFNSLAELVELINTASEKLPESIFIYGVLQEGKTVQLSLDYNAFSHNTLNKNDVREYRYQKLFGDIIVEKGHITQKKLNEVHSIQRHSKYNERIGEILVRLGLITPEHILKILQNQIGIKQIHE